MCLERILRFVFLVAFVNRLFQGSFVTPIYFFMAWCAMHVCRQFPCRSHLYFILLLQVFVFFLLLVVCYIFSYCTSSYN